MNLRQNKEKNAQQMLTGVILTLFIMLLLCTIFTNQDAASVSKLKARQPDKIQYLDDGKSGCSLCKQTQSTSA